MRDFDGLEVVRAIFLCGIVFFVCLRWGVGYRWTCWSFLALQGYCPLGCFYFSFILALLDFLCYWSFGCEL